jgi:lipoprotein
LKSHLKRLCCFFTAIVIVVGISSCSKEKVLKEGAEKLDELIKSIPSMLQTDKRIFTAQVTAVKDETALINFYNIDINDYTVYEVEVVDDISGFMPDTPVKLYSIGSSEQFDRIKLKKGETYLFNATPWVYGEQIIYLLPTYDTSYAKLDTASRLVYTDDSGTYDMCSYQEFLDLYQNQLTTFLETNNEYFLPENILKRHIDEANEILSINSNTDIFYDASREYEWIPSKDFSNQTIEKSKELLDSLKALENAGTVTIESIANVYEN